MFTDTLTPSRRRQWQGTWRSFQAWATSHHTPLDPAQWVPEDLRDYRDALVQANRAAATIRIHLDLLRSAARYAGNPADPGASLHYPSRQEPAPQGLTRIEKNALLRAVGGQPRPRHRLRDLALAQLLCHTGLRIHEALALTWDDVAWDPRRPNRAGWITVRAASGKGQRERRVPVNATARSHLAAWWHAHPSRAGAVFCTIQGAPGPVSARAMADAFRRYARRAAIAQFHFHRLRHTFAYDLLAQGVPLPTVAALMGHRRIQTTYRYSLPQADDLAAAVDRLAVH